jgi:hypothetical protein
VASAVRSLMTNGIRIVDTIHNGGVWSATEHYDGTVHASGAGWMPYDNAALLEIDGEGVDGCWVHGQCIGNYNGRGLLWVHNAQGHSTGIEVLFGGAADKVSKCGVHIEAYAPVVDVKLEGWNWSGFGPAWVCGVYIESYGPNYVQEVVARWGGRYLPGNLMALASRNGGTFRDVEMRQMRSIAGDRVGVSMPAIELSTAYGQDIRIRGLTHSGYSTGYNACPATNFSAQDVISVPVI